MQRRRRGGIEYSSSWISAKSIFPYQDYFNTVCCTFHWQQIRPQLNVKPLSCRRIFRFLPNNQEDNTGIASALHTIDDSCSLCEETHICKVKILQVQQSLSAVCILCSCIHWNQIEQQLNVKILSCSGILRFLPKTREARDCVSVSHCGQNTA